MNKQNQFIDWLRGKNVAFPFFQSMPKVEMPITAKKCGIKDCEEYAIEELELDVVGNLTPLCEGHANFYAKNYDIEEARATGN